LRALHRMPDIQVLFLQEAAFNLFLLSTRH
jgi:hypothetical protein